MLAIDLARFIAAMLPRRMSGRPRRFYDIKRGGRRQYVAPPEARSWQPNMRAGFPLTEFTRQLYDDFFHGGKSN
jgi:hypothetical protein